MEYFAHKVLQTLITYNFLTSYGIDFKTIEKKPLVFRTYVKKGIRRYFKY